MWTVKISKDEAQGIYMRSLSLGEIAALQPFLIYADNEDISLQKKDQWRQIVSQGDSENFEKRFLWSNIDPSLIDNFLRTPRFREQIILPAWVQTLNRCFLSFSEAQARDEDRQ